MAAARGRTAIVTLLLGAKAKVDPANSYGGTPLTDAIVPAYASASDDWMVKSGSGMGDSVYPHG